jgi:hypothetical protein
MERKCSIIRLRAERRIGELLAKTAQRRVSAALNAQTSPEEKTFSLL